MQLIAIAAVLGLATPAFPYTVWYDSLYDGTTTSLNSVVCSTGEYGLITYGYNTFGQVPSYPYIGGAPQIQSWNSPNCGTCWNLTYTDPHGTSATVSFTAISSSGIQDGFIISGAGMSDLTGGNDMTLDGVQITVVQVPESVCGMTF